MMQYSNIPAAQLLVLSCKAAGIKDIVISPGSRNAPLTLSFTGDSYFNCFSIVDERCAAFFALGIAQNQQRPVALVCTSGSALLNYYPAIAEAFYSDIPLLVISADRPPYKIDVGDGQTIRQDNVFERHIGFSANLEIDVSHAQERLRVYAPEHLKRSQQDIYAHNKSLIEQAFRVVFELNLPVHINIPFEEPLYGLLEDATEPLAPMAIATQKSESEIDFETIRKLWGSAERKLILVGVNPPDNLERELLNRLAEDPSVIVLTETTSNIHHPSFFPSIDSIIFPIEKSRNIHERFLALQPEILLTFGGLVVSKKVKAFLRKYRPKRHWHVHPTKAYNTYFALSEHFKMRPQPFLNDLLREPIRNTSDYFSKWHSVKQHYESQRATYLNKAPFSDFKAFEGILKSIPRNYQVHLSNSSTVRYAQLFDMAPSLKVYCNRGTSGIDGSTSTALGASIYHESPTVLITGDLSFFYDSNALWNDYVRKDFRIILINNSGGGIFRILPGFDGSERFGTFFETKHQLTAEENCKQFDWQYDSCNDLTSLNASLINLFKTRSKPSLLEVFTPRELNDKILLGYFDFISSEYQ